MNTTVTPTSAVQTVINQCSARDKVIYLPAGQLEREVFNEVADRLKKIGGKWNTGLQGFAFKHNPARLLADLKAGRKINFKQDFQFFGTPESTADYMVENTYLYDDPQLRILEPSAGHGSIINAIHRQFPGAVVDYLEIAPESKDILSELSNARYVGDDFLTTELDPYDFIIANPPFTAGQDIAHVRRMQSLLAQYGQLTSIMSRTWLTASDNKSVEFRNWLNTLNFSIEGLPANEFAESGTSVATVMLRIFNRTKPVEQFQTGATSHTTNDLILTMESIRETVENETLIYKVASSKEGAEALDYMDVHFQNHIAKSVRQYIKDHPDAVHMHLITPQQIAEVKKLLIDYLPQWKKENL